MNSVIAYYRVSTQEQGRSGLGLDAQRLRVEQFCQQQGLTIIAHYTEVETGKGSDALARRPQLAEALAMAKKHKARIVVAKLDRLSRSVHFISGLMAGPIKFTCADRGMDVGNLELHMLAAFAEHEREQISQRTREALAAAKARGVQLGNTTNLAEARAKAKASKAADRLARNAPMLPLIHQLRREGIHGYSAQARVLNERRIPSPSGGTWHATTVRNLTLFLEAPSDAL